VPMTRPRLADRERVLLTVQPAMTSATQRQGSAEEPSQVPLGDRSARDRAVAIDFHPDGC
jgi:hypothetical protein